MRGNSPAANAAVGRIEESNQSRLALHVPESAVPRGIPKPSGASRPILSRSMLAKVFKAYDVRATYPKPLNERIAWQVG